MPNSEHTPFAIGESVNRLLRSAKLAGVNCQCAGSLVVLRGAVPSAQNKQKAITIARQLCGMGEICNEIQIVN